MRPIYEHYRQSRPVYALDLPGFGFSERTDRPYLPRLMTDAVHAMTDAIRRTHDGVPVDVMAVSLSSEYAARAAHEGEDVIEADREDEDLRRRLPCLVEHVDDG